MRVYTRLGSFDRKRKGIHNHHGVANNSTLHHTHDFQLPTAPRVHNLRQEQMKEE
jgi:hypothetical protein